MHNAKSESTTISGRWYHSANINAPLRPRTNAKMAPCEGNREFQNRHLFHNESGELENVFTSSTNDRVLLCEVYVTARTRI